MFYELDKFYNELDILYYGLYPLFYELNILYNELDTLLYEL